MPGHAAAALREPAAQIVAHSRTAGATPKSSPVTTESPSAKASARPFTAISSSRGWSPGSSACSARTPHTASPSPSAPPASASSTLSVSSWRTSRRREAPSAARIATSRSRVATRASIRLATLAQAISRTSPTAPRKTSSAGRISPDDALLQSRPAPRPSRLLLAGYSCLEPPGDRPQLLPRLCQVRRPAPAGRPPGGSRCDGPGWCRW